MNPFQELIVCSPDTDVLLLLKFFYQELYTRTIFRTGNRIRDINIGLVYEMLGEEKSKALLGFHCFTGCDQTAKFYWNSKLSCWKTFLNTQSQVITAFNELGDGVIVSTSVRNGLTLYLLVRDITKHVVMSRQDSNQQIMPPKHLWYFKATLVPLLQRSS